MDTAKENNFFHHALALNQELKQYYVRKVLGGGGFGLTYLAEDTRLQRWVAIKEYFPNNLAVREATQHIHPTHQQDARGFAWGLDRFIREARVLVKFNHANIVKVHDFFKLNNTAYIVMEYERGQSLGDAMSAGETATEEEIMSILPPLLDALEAIHGVGILHRDIKPDNIYLRDRDNSPVLLDFGSARYDVSRHSSPMTSIVTRGYAPFEQYTTDGMQQGSWTDIYAMGGVLYRAITGNVPVDATERLGAVMRNEPDPLPSIYKQFRWKFNRHLLSGIDWAMNVMEKDRPQSIALWREKILPPSSFAGKLLSHLRK
ncbi:serine/threonine protein kinase [Candidatus Venteria ishoeyi]|uniref:non-specific serine/threonine protein kinase n=1 Tax=Candidatus Venteria ishoeyi TaxID=1899563 RepID=A0A1H6F3W1_9GAMM|nr:serine/threonine-protein kinase [Candidatus Venteria ishoeyi]SEH04868.1 Serine/threonine-protein kinase D [Candidatus Venteria ishoeyi]